SMHVNRQVREAAATRLEGTGAFQVVETNRSANLVDAELPAAVVGTPTDEVELESKDDDERRTITLTVTIVADGSSETLDDDLDELRAHAEAALAGDLDGLAFDLRHTGGELTLGSDEEGERWFGFYVLTWEVIV